MRQVLRMEQRLPQRAIGGVEPGPSDWAELAVEDDLNRSK